MYSPELRFYSFLSRVSYLRNYESKIMLIAFLGTHVPLLGLLFYFILSHSFRWDDILSVLLIALLATLVGTALTLWALHHLLVPMTFASKALRDYLRERKLPSLPTQFTDEAGTLMADTVRTIKQLDEALRHLTNYDQLTGLPNRSLFHSYLQETLVTAKRNHQAFYLLSLDLDRFSQFNTTLGYEQGDHVLREVSRRLANCLHENDILCRLGSDEFAILHTPSSRTSNVEQFSKGVLQVLTQPFFIHPNQQVYMTASIGITLYPDDGSSSDQLLKNSDIARHQAKESGRNTYQFYDATVNSQLQERLYLEQELREAISRQQLHLHYQPKIELAQLQVLSLEALLRWHHPTLGWVSPGKFIPIAEDSDLILSIGEWVLRTACQQFRRWKQAGLPPVSIAVNLSARQFRQPHLVEVIHQIIAETEMDISYLELELTESILMENIEQAIAITEQLHQMGIRLALDDFGTGYSSLNYLRRFPIHTLKIDQSFVRNLPQEASDAAIAKAIIALGQSLDLQITAEGVETAEQFHYLRSQGCDDVQGYFFSRPLPAEQVMDILRQPDHFKQSPLV
ncbi:MAG: EAL domain-containing protein [Cyanobacteriota bacterium]|nr:EAL domain-containing protein [Cyanobacteriota bacterium]